MEGVQNIGKRYGAGMYLVEKLFDGRADLFINWS